MLARMFDSQKGKCWIFEQRRQSYTLSYRLVEPFKLNCFKTCRPAIAMANHAYTSLGWRCNGRWCGKWRTRWKADETSNKLLLFILLGVRKRVGERMVWRINEPVAILPSYLGRMARAMCRFFIFSCWAARAATPFTPLATWKLEFYTFIRWKSSDSNWKLASPCCGPRWQSRPRCISCLAVR